MSVSKRVRFEVLRRDGYTCRYCRSTENPLTVDHVTPVALGGTDTPDNLVAACRDCNAGKSSAAPDSSLVEEVREDALRHAEMIKQAYAVLVERMGERDDYCNEFAQVFRDLAPADWDISVGRWFEMGVPVELVVDAAKRAMAKQSPFTRTERFKYMCGIVWNQVHAVNEAVELKSAILGAFMTEDDREALDQQTWSQGYRAGDDAGTVFGAAIYRDCDKYARLLHFAVERTSAASAAEFEISQDYWLPSIRLLHPGEEMQPAEEPW